MEISETRLFNKLDAISTQLNMLNKIEYLKLMDKLLTENSGDLVGYSRKDWIKDMNALGGKLSIGN